jgi:hypothetical protein
VAFVFGSGASRRAVVFAAGILVSVLALWMASSAKATELLYWDNFEENTIAVANIDGTGGGALNLTGVELLNPEGMALDTATGRLYVASSGEAEKGKPGQILYVNLDGSGAGVLNTAGAPLEEPYGVAIDPVTRTIFWTNTGKAGDAIGWAHLDGSGGGALNTSGVTVSKPYKIAVDSANGKVYWGNTEGTSIGFANIDNSGGGGTVDTTGTTPPASIYAVAVDEAAGRVYWLDSSSGGKEHVAFVNAAGGGGGELSLAGSAFKQAYGLAIDPTVGRAYWANYGNEAEKAGAFGFANLDNSGGGSISIATAPLKGPQDPVIIKSPTSTTRPKLRRRTSRSKPGKTTLRCSTGGWAADYPGSFVYQSPRSYVYKWKRNGKKIGGTKATRKAKTPGKYTCIVTATNSVGSSTRASKPVKVKKPRKKRH